MAKLKKFQVNREDVYIQPVIVKAKNIQEAIEKVEKGKGEEQKDWFEYQRTLKSTNWVVYDVPDVK